MAFNQNDWTTYGLGPGMTPTISSTPTTSAPQASSSSAATGIAQQLLKEGQISATDVTAVAAAIAQAQQHIGQITASGQAQNGQLWSQTISSLGKLPGGIVQAYLSQAAPQVPTDKLLTDPPSYLGTSPSLADLATLDQTTPAAEY
jgi:hypothetical protein